ncbi:MAG TPA: hypothetical protein VGG20_07130 [Thermoanaerobaculia bacterium]
MSMLLSRTEYALWLLATLTGTFPLCFHVMRNSDLWWHLAAGRLIVAKRSIPSTDSWSFTAFGHPWLNHEWLAQVIFYFLEKAWGTLGLMLWFFGILLLTAGLLYDGLVRWTGRPLLSLIGVVWGMALASSFFEFRPHLYSLLGLAAVLRWVLLGKRPDLWWLTAVFLIWANLHAGVVLGLMALGLWGLACAFYVPEEGRRTDLRRMATVCVACFAATLINPHGVELSEYPLRVALGLRGTFRGLLEYLPPFAPGGLRPALYPWAVAIFLAATVCLLAKSRRLERRERLAALILLAGMSLAMSLVSARFIPLFAIAQAPIVAGAMSTLLVKQAVNALAHRLPRWLLPAAAILAGCVTLRPYPFRPDVFRNLVSEETFPVDVATFMEMNHLHGNVFAYQGWGGYLQWRTSGALRVYYDTRADTVFDSATYNSYVRVQSLIGGWQQTIDGSASDFFLWPRLPWNQLPNVSQPSALLATGRWHFLYADGAAILLARNSVESPSHPTATPDTAYRRLALGIRAMEEGRPRDAIRHLNDALELDPRLLPACRNLAAVVANQGDEAKAWKLARRCNAIFPDPGTEAGILEELARVRAPAM